MLRRSGTSRTAYSGRDIVRPLLSCLSASFLMKAIAEDRDILYGLGFNPHRLWWARACSRLVSFIIRLFLGVVLLAVPLFASALNSFY